MIKKISLLLLIVVSVAAYYIFDLQQYLSIDVLKAQLAENFLRAAVVFGALYVLVTSLNLPGASVLTIAAGAVFGLWYGVLVVSFASTIGATIAMLVARTLLRDWAQERFSNVIDKVNAGLEKDGVSYLFTLRLIPFIPFFVINPVFGLTRMPVWLFFVVSQLGMLPATFLYVNVGATLGNIEAVSFWSVFTPNVLFSFAALIAFPFVVKRVVAVVKRHRQLRYYKKPKTFDTNLVVVGAGSAGLVSAYIAATVKAKVTLVEKHLMGGDCLNTGCVPSKALIRSAKAVSQIKKASALGVHSGDVRVDFREIMGHVHGVIAKIEPHDSVERYTRLGVNCERGEAHVLSPYTVRIGDKVINTRKIIIAAGAVPRVPKIPGLDTVPYYTSENLWSLEILPQNLLVMGGGAIGCELTQAFSRLGSNVTVAEMAPRLLPNTDQPVSDFLQENFVAEGINVLVDCKVNAFLDNDGQFFAVVEHNGQEKKVQFDAVIVALGRAANTDTSALKHLPFELNNNGTIRVDEYLETSVPGIYACGDIVGPYQFTHAAAHQAWYASVNALFGRFKAFKVDYSVIPWVIFTDPEIAHVGATEAELKKMNSKYDVTEYPLSDLDRAIAEGETQGFVRVLTPLGSDKILGATIVSSRAGEMLTEFVTAMKNKKGLNAILGTIHSYPTFGEAAKYVSGDWKRKNKPEKALALLAKWFSWSLSS